MKIKWFPADYEQVSEYIFDFKNILALALCVAAEGYFEYENHEIFTQDVYDSEQDEQYYTVAYRTDKFNKKKMTLLVVLPDMSHIVVEGLKARTLKRYWLS